VDFGTFLVQCLNSVQYGLLLFLVASGLTLIFGIMGVINLAHGSWFRQQDQWVSKHAENRSAISLIPCYKILTGNEEFALAA